MFILPGPQESFAERRNRSHWFYLSPEGKALATSQAPEAGGGREEASLHPPSRPPAERREADQEGQLSSRADREGGVGLELCSCVWSLLRTGPPGASTQQRLQGLSTLLVGFIDLVFSKLPQVVKAGLGEPRGAQQEPQTLPCLQWADQGCKGSIPLQPSSHHLVGHSPSMITTMMLGSAPVLSPGPMRRFTWSTSPTP